MFRRPWALCCRGLKDEARACRKLLLRSGFRDIPASTAAIPPCCVRNPGAPMAASWSATTREFSGTSSVQVRRSGVDAAGSGGGGDGPKGSVGGSKPGGGNEKNKEGHHGGGRGRGDEDQDDDERERMLSMMKVIGFTFIVPFILIVLSGRFGSRRPRESRPQVNMTTGGEPPQEVTWSDFYHNMLMAGEVQEIIIHSGLNRATVILRPDAIYRGQRVLGNVFRMQIPGAGGSQGRSRNEGALEDKIREAEARLGIQPGGGVSITYERNSETLGRVITLFFGLGLVTVLFMMGRNIRTQVAGMANPFTRMRRADFTLIDPQLLLNTGKGVKFSDVAGLKEAKVEVKEFVDYLKNPEKYAALGARPPRGALLTGPPGCGKTMLAKAVANEANVPFLSMNGSEFIEMIGGLGAARVRDLFAQARKRAPSIVYIDEIDAIGRKRSGMSGAAGGGGGGGGGGAGEAEQTLNQLLVEMDGITSGSGGKDVIVLSSTNRADVLDKALLRPGRFDRLINIDLPTVSERKEILEQHMKGVKLSDKPEKFSERMATLTPGFSGADLANLVNEAALHAARTKHATVGVDDLEYAVERVIAGPEKKSNVLGPEEKRVVAYHESGHALVGWMLKHSDALLKVTILPRTSQALGFAQYTPAEKRLFSPEELNDRMCMALGGRVAESLTFNRITTGAQNDLQKVTRMADAQVRSFGFSEAIGPVSFDEENRGGGQRPYSKRLHAMMEQEASRIIAEAYKRTENLLTEHRDKLEVVAEALLERETLNYSDVEALLGPPPFGKKHLVSPVDFENQLKEQASLADNLK